MASLQRGFGLNQASNLRSDFIYVTTSSLEAFQEVVPLIASINHRTERSISKPAFTFL